MKQLPDESVDLILTDPPYGLFKHKIETKVNIKLFIKEAYRISKNNSFLIYFGMQPSLTKWNLNAFKYFNYKNEVIWYKRISTCIFSDMLRVFENIMILQKGKKKFNDVRRPYTDVKLSLADFVETNTFTRAYAFMKQLEKKNKVIDKYKNGDCELVDAKYNNISINFGNNFKQKKRIISQYNIREKGLRPQNLISFLSHNQLKMNNPEFNVKHPTVKPIQLIEYLILLCSNPNDLVFDGFLGSGTTSVACIRSNRNYIGCEIDKGYFDIAEKRINAELDNQATKLFT